MRRWIWTIFNEIPLWIDKSDFMQDESPGFQLTGGHAADLLKKRERDETGRERKEEEGGRKAFN